MLVMYVALRFCESVRLVGFGWYYNINKNNKSDCEKAGNMILYNQGGKF